MFKQSLNFNRIGKALPIILITLAALWLRVTNLGYSDYQGDEIKALVQPIPGQSWVEFILAQKKGPVQFLVTSLIYRVNSSFENEFLTRLPFALAGVLAVLVFYVTLKLLTDRRIALYAALFFAINGLFVGLTRIVQYQSFVLLFSCLAVYFFALALYQPRWWLAGIYLGMLSWALAILTHYDGAMILPFVAYLLLRWLKDHRHMPLKSWLGYIVLPAVLAVLVLGGFYLALFGRSSDISQAYWLSRITGIEDNASLIQSSLANFKLYNPVFALPIYVALAILSFFQIKRVFPYWLWFAFPFVVMEFIIFDPGTHIYTYLLPATVILAFGLQTLEKWLVKLYNQRLGTISGVALGTIVFGLLFTISHFIFVDHTPEYPWQSRRFLVWKIERPSDQYKLWVYGFPYYRHWEEIGETSANTPPETNYASNENPSITTYYVDRPFDKQNPDVYINIINPQSFRVRTANDKIRYWTNNYPPEKTFLNNGQVVAEIYVMPPGSLDEIKAKGY